MTELTIKELFEIASGKEPDGIPLSASALSIERYISEREVRTIKEIMLNNAVLNFYYSGGCVVATMDFPIEQRAYYLNAKKTCEDYLANIDDTVYDNDYLFIHVYPHLFEGRVEFHLHQPVFVEGYQTDHSFRLIIAFDNEAGKALHVRTDENFNYAEIATEVRQELEEMKRQIEQEERDALEQLKEFERDTMYEDMLKEQLNQYNPELDNYQNATENDELGKYKQSAPVSSRYRFVEEEGEEI